MLPVSSNFFLHACVLTIRDGDALKQPLQNLLELAASINPRASKCGQ